MVCRRRSLCQPADSCPHDRLCWPAGGGRANPLRPPHPSAVGLSNVLYAQGSRESLRCVRAVAIVSCVGRRGQVLEEQFRCHQRGGPDHRLDCLLEDLGHRRHRCLWLLPNVGAAAREPHLLLHVRMRALLHAGILRYRGCMSASREPSGVPAINVRRGCICSYRLGQRCRWTRSSSVDVIHDTGACGGRRTSATPPGVLVRCT
mmetsp:Transcript_24144/g.54938  ORF Transcript_24144/g.54938 Transcript_24144/m.54938 type:complete len:204 (+) Transcript_24144:151-762(+)